MESTELKISTKAHTTLPLSELKWFQGNLAEADNESKDKLERSLKKHGIFKAFDVWDDGKERHIIDGHARCMVLQERFGYTNEPVPVNFTLADSYLDAKEKVLLSRSQSNKTTDEGLYDFMKDMNLDEVSGLIDLPGIDFEQINAVNYVNELSEWSDADMPDFKENKDLDVRVIVHFDKKDEASEFIEISGLSVQKELKNCYICQQ